MPCTSLSASKRVVVPDRQVSWLRIIAAGLLPKAFVHGGSRPRLPGYSDGFAPDSHRLSFSALVEPPVGVVHLSRRFAGITSPKGDRIIGRPARKKKTPPECIGRRFRSFGGSGDARLLEVGFELFDGREPL